MLTTPRLAPCKCDMAGLPNTALCRDVWSVLLISAQLHVVPEHISGLCPSVLFQLPCVPKLSVLFPTNYHGRWQASRKHHAPVPHIAGQAHPRIEQKRRPHCVAEAFDSVYKWDAWAV